MIRVGVGIGPPSGGTRPNGLDVAALDGATVTLVDSGGVAVGLAALPRLVLGPFTFAVNPRDNIQVTEPPLLAMHSPPGGSPRYQYMGRGETRITLRGKLSGDTAWASLAALRALNGTRQPLSYGALSSGACWARLDWTFNRDDDIDYGLNLAVESLVVNPAGGAFAGATSTVGNGAFAGATSAVGSPAQAAGQAQIGNPASQAAPSVGYTVVTGDSLWSIAQAKYGDGSLFPVLARLNGIDDPQSIAAGQVLQLPSDAGAARALKAQQDRQFAMLPNDAGTGLNQVLLGAP